MMTTTLRNYHGEHISTDDVAREIRARLAENPHILNDRQRIDALAEYIIREWALSSDTTTIALLIHDIARETD